MTAEKIQTLHPQGKQGVNIDLQKYTALKNFILETLAIHEEMSYQDLNEQAKSQLAGSFNGSIPWYLVTVKLDLEARGLIRRIPHTSPHKLTLA